VDDSSPDTLWLGAVVPKRCARRAVTRTLLKREIRAAVQRLAPSLTPGLWVVRLRAPFDRTIFRSAASDALREAARSELHTVLARAVR
jgi:ribonuclease P protein component